MRDKPVVDGVLLGTADGQGYSTYRPRVVGVAGREGDPALDSPRFDSGFPEYQRGRYIYSDNLVRGYIQVGFVGTPWDGDIAHLGFDVGKCSYLFELPFPARRPDPTLPCVIGTGMTYFSFTAIPINLTCAAILADDGWKLPCTGVSATNEMPNPENFLQLQAPYAVRQGSGTMTGSATTTFNHNLYSQDPTKINPAETQITPTSVPSANNIEPLSLKPTTGTAGGAQFDLVGEASVGAGGITFDYKTEQHALTRRSFNNGLNEAMSNPNVPTSVSMVGTMHPFDLTQVSGLGPFFNMFISFRYEPG